MKRVLLAEGNSILRTALSYELEMRNYEVIQASNSNHLRSHLSECQPIMDIIICDIALEGINKVDLIEFLSHNLNSQNVPTIFLIAFHEVKNTWVRDQLHDDDYIVKPFQTDKLVHMIEQKISLSSLQ